MIFPGASAERSSTVVPWRRARVCSVPAANLVPSGNIIRAAQMLSRPNRVRNQGTPALRKVLSGSADSASRSASRSSSDWVSSRPTRWSAQRTVGRSHSTGCVGGTSMARACFVVTDHRSVTACPGARRTSQANPPESATPTSAVATTVIRSSDHSSDPPWIVGTRA
jgi:hypothetical protein